MGNGVSGKASANLKTIYLDVDGRKNKVIGKFLMSFCFVVLFVFSFRAAPYVIDSIAF